jgi:ATP-dependent exoDNAse (exonuclease V) alpha subunit
MIAGPNALRESLNDRARQRLAAADQLGHGIVVAGKEYRDGEHVIARKNKRDLRADDGRWVMNGSVGRVVGVDSERSALTVDFEQLGIVSLPSWYLKEGNVDHAYARTTYSVQGKTLNSTNYKPTDSSSFEEGYVAITRARLGTRIYLTETDVNQERSPNCNDGHRPKDDGLVLSALKRRRANRVARSDIEIGHT